MNFETILIVVVGSIVIGVLGGFATRSIWIGIASPIVLIVLSLMYIAIKPDVPIEEPKKEEDSSNTTQPTQE